MKPAAYFLCTYVGFAAGSLQVLAFKDRWEGLGVLILITIILLIASMVHVRHSKPQKLKNRVVRKRSVIKGKAKVLKS
jgi:hypothetical protein